MSSAIGSDHGMRSRAIRRAQVRATDRYRRDLRSLAEAAMASALRAHM